MNTFLPQNVTKLLGEIHWHLKKGQGLGIDGGKSQTVIKIKVFP